MTEAERAREWKVSYNTALGRSCGTDEPTFQQIADCEKEANEWVKRCEEAERKP